MDAQSSGNDVVPYRWVILILATATFLITFFIRFAWPPLIPVVVPILKMKMSQAGAYDYKVVNNTLREAVRQIGTIIAAERLRNRTGKAKLKPAPKAPRPE